MLLYSKEMGSREQRSRLRYFEWLCCKVNAGPGQQYDIFAAGILRALFEKEFYWLVDMDSNRAEDGKDLRGVYEYETRRKIRSFKDEPCSCLEMLVALAHRWDYDISYDPDIGDQTAARFWEMIGNLGLDQYAFLDYDDVRVDEKIETWLGRTYRYDGLGGLFPLNDPAKDQRKMEIWMQMQAYIIEQMVEIEDSEEEFK